LNDKPKVDILVERCEKERKKEREKEGERERKRKWKRLGKSERR